MSKLIFLCACIIPLLTGCKNKTAEKQIYAIPELTYPVTDKVKISDNYFGTVVQDPYRWLENDTAKEVEAWVKEQNNLTFSFLNQIPFRKKIKSRLEEIYDYASINRILRAGDYILFSKNDGLQNQPVIYKREGESGKEEILSIPTPCRQMEQ